MKSLEHTLEGWGSGDGRAGRSPRSLREATLSGRGLRTASSRSFFAGGLDLDLFADGVEVAHHIVVVEADHAHTEVLEGSGAHRISSQSFWGEVLRAVEFYDQFERRAVEVSDVLPDGPLPQPTHGLIVQKLIPKLALRWCECCPQLLRPRRQPFVIRKPSHPKSLPRLNHPNPLCEGVAPRQRAGGASRPPAAPSSLKSRGQS